jgi:hypothetical protein
MTAPAERPRSVRWATILLAAVAAMGVIDAVTSAISAAQLAKAAPLYERLLAEASEDSYEGTGIVPLLHGSLWSSVVVGVLAALVLAPLAIAVGRGSRVARVLAWCAAGVLALVQVISAAGDTIGAAIVLDNASPLDAAQDALIPDWYLGLHYVAETGMMLLPVVAAVLLALAPAQLFFARRPVTADDRRLWTVKRPG